MRRILLSVSGLGFGGRWWGRHDGGMMYCGTMEILIDDWMCERGSILSDRETVDDQGI